MRAVAIAVDLVGDGVLVESPEDIPGILRPACPSVGILCHQEPVSCHFSGIRLLFRGLVVSTRRRDRVTGGTVLVLEVTMGALGLPPPLYNLPGIRPQAGLLGVRLVRVGTRVLPVPALSKACEGVCRPSFLAQTYGSGSPLPKYWCGSELTGPVPHFSREPTAYGGFSDTVLPISITSWRTVPTGTQCNERRFNIQFWDTIKQNAGHIF